jgi:hypothetical protein
LKLTTTKYDFFYLKEAQKYKNYSIPSIVIDNYYLIISNIKLPFNIQLNNKIMEKIWELIKAVY